MAKLPKFKKTKKEEKEKRPKRKPLPPVPLTPRDGVLLTASSAFFAICLICGALAIQAAIDKTPYGVMTRAVSESSAAASAAEMGGGIWFSMPDGTYVNGTGSAFEAPEPFVYQEPTPPAAIAEDPAPSQPLPPEIPEPPDVPELPEQEENTVQPVAPAQPASPADGDDANWTIPVWITGFGGRYHSRKDCPALAGGNAREASIQEAVALDCTRCPECWDF